MYAALKNHATYIPEGPILTWLIGIAKNMNRTRIKRETNSKLIFVENYIETDRLTDSIEDYFRENKDVFTAIEALPDKNKKAYQLSLIGYSYRDIAKQLGTTEKYVKTMMGKNKRKLMSIIESHADNN